LPGLTLARFSRLSGLSLRVVPFRGSAETG